ncbi:MAG TPA: PAS domain S-box protein [Nitrospira sp.]|nr:PAS domain S-box protein [Nitrospira sp.]
MPMPTFRIVPNGPLVYAVSAACFGTIALLDLTAPLGIAVWLLYFLPIWLLSRISPFEGRRVVLGAVIATTLIAAMLFLAPTTLHWMVVLNRGIGVALIWIVSLLLIRARRQQMALSDSEAQFRANFEMAAVGQVQVSAKTGRFIRVNNRFCEITGYDRSDLMAMTPRDLTHPDDQASDKAGVERLLRGDVEEYHNEKRYVRKDGDIRWVLVSARLIRDAARQPARTIAVVEDVTERKEAETALMRLTLELELRVADRTKALTDSQQRLRALTSELNLTEQRERWRLAGELHDYLAQLLVVARMKLCQVPHAADTEAVRAAIAEADEVLNRSLTYTRSLVAQLAPPVLRQFGLSSALSWLGEEMKRHDLLVEVEVPADRPPLSEDQAGQLFQAVRELLMNVVKHAKIGRALVRLEHENERLVVTVQDEGVGFDAGPELEKASDKFGLFSIRERMYALGGTFSIESAPQAGTTARLTLPLCGEAAFGTGDSEATAAEQMRPSDRGVPGRRRSVLPPARIRVLLVDDHAMVREGLRTLLNAYPEIEVVGEAGNGEDAIEVTRHLLPDVVVMDVNMPKMDGIEATKHITQLLPASVVIGLSVNASAHMQAAMKAAGALTLLTKESAAESLYRTIKGVHLGVVERLDAQEPLPLPFLE